MSMLDEGSLVVAMVSQTSEEYATRKQGDLDGLDVDVDAVLVPRPCSQCPRHDRRKDPIEVEEGEDRAATVSHLVRLLELAVALRLTELQSRLGHLETTCWGKRS